MQGWCLKIMDIPHQCSSMCIIIFIIIIGTVTLIIIIIFIFIIISLLTFQFLASWSPRSFLEPLQFLWPRIAPRSLLQRSKNELAKINLYILYKFSTNLLLKIVNSGAPYFLIMKWGSSSPEILTLLSARLSWSNSSSLWSVMEIDPIPVAKRETWLQCTVQEVFFSQLAGHLFWAEIFKNAGTHKLALFCVISKHVFFMCYARQTWSVNKIFVTKR